MNTTKTEQLDFNRLNFIVEELNKIYIPTDNVKLEFFKRYLPELEKDYKNYQIIMPSKYEKELPIIDWISYSPYCENPTAIKRTNLNFQPEVQICSTQLKIGY